MAKPTGALFDCNGVIIDDYLLQKEVWKILSQKIRQKPITDQEMVEHVLSIPTLEVFHWITEGKLSEDELRQLDDEKRAIIIELSKDTSLYRLMPGIELFFDELQAHGVPMTIVTSARESSVISYFKTYPFEKWFEFEKVIYNDGKHNNKPAPDPYILGAKNLGLAASDCAVFEDSPSGVISGFAAGSRNIIGISSNLPEGSLQKLPGVVKVVQDFFQVSVADIFVV